MNNPGLISILLLGTVLMCLPISIQMKWYGVTMWKCIVISAMLVPTGLIGSRLWYYLENQSFLGRSFYGVIFIAPIIFFPVSKVLRISYGYTMDFCAPAGCLTLAMVKVQCLLDGCCKGVVLYINEKRQYVRFPSQIVEMTVFLFIFCILLIIGSKEKNRKKVFLWFLILYGGSRFILDFFREHDQPYALGLSAGSFWSLISVVAGIVCLLFARSKFRSTDSAE